MYFHAKKLNVDSVVYPFQNKGSHYCKKSSKTLMLMCQEGKTRWISANFVARSSEKLSFLLAAD